MAKMQRDATATREAAREIQKSIRGKVRIKAEVRAGNSPGYCQEA